MLCDFTRRKMARKWGKVGWGGGGGRERVGCFVCVCVAVCVDCLWRKNPLWDSEMFSFYYYYFYFFLPPSYIIVNASLWRVLRA